MSHYYKVHYLVDTFHKKRKIPRGKIFLTFDLKFGFLHLTCVLNVNIQRKETMDVADVNRQPLSKNSGYQKNII